MTDTIRSKVARVGGGFIVLVALVLACLLGFYANYLILLAALVTLPFLDWRVIGTDRAARRLGTGFALAFALVAIAQIGAAQTPSELAKLVNYLPFVLALPIALAIATLGSPSNGARLGWLALAGVAIGVGIAVFDGLILGSRRAGYLTSDPIRLAHTAILLACFAVVALPHVEGKRRYWLLSGLALTALTVVLAGARTGLLSFLPLAALAIAMIVPRSKAVLAMVGTGVVAVVAVIGLATILDSQRIEQLPGLLGDFAAGEVQDRSVANRFEFYRTGWAAFLDAPLFGHGRDHFMEAIGPYLAEGSGRLVRFSHLHNDLLTLAAMSGLFGIGAYLVLLATPLVAVWATPRDPLFSLRRNLALVLVTGYALMGISDTMLVFELHMTLYVAWSAAIVGFCRPRQPALR